MKRLLVGLTALVSMAVLLFPGVALASTNYVNTLAASSPKDAVCEGVGLTGGGSGCSSNGGPDVDSTIKNAINLFSVIVGIVAVIMIIIGGLKYVTSAGDSAKVSSAKDTILYAIIGLVVVAMSQLIVRFVINKAVQQSPNTPPAATQKP